MSNQENLSSLSEDYTGNLLDSITQSNLSSFVDSEADSLNPDMPDDFPDKYDKLGNKLYSAFGYPSKAYYKVISQFIEAYSNPGEVILDPMAGSGSTGVAALNSGRKSILSDGSVLSSFICRNLCAPVSAVQLQKEFDRLEDKVNKILSDLYSTPCTKCGEKSPLHYIIESDIYSCPECDEEFSLYFNDAEGKSKYKCPHCENILKTNVPDNKKHRVERRKPVEVKYRCENSECDAKTEKVKVTDEMVEKWSENISKHNHHLEDKFVPEDRLITGRWYTRENSWPGIDKGAKLIDFFTEQNKIALTVLNDAIEDIENRDLREQMKFVFLSSLIRSSKRMYETSVVKTYYQVPSVGKVQNVWSVFERKFKTFKKSRDQLRKFEYVSENIDSFEQIFRSLNSDAKDLDNIPDNSIDYLFVDPPYGSQIGYYELNKFFTCWMEEDDELDEEVIIPMETDDEDEYVEKWGQMIRPVFEESVRVLKPGRYITIMFHNKSDKIWNKLREILTDLDLEYISFVDRDRGTTFHTNRMSDTSPKSAFITYRKTNGNSYGELSEDSRQKIKNRLKEETLEEMSIREIQGLVIKMAHKLDVKNIPSEKETKEIIDEIK